MCIPVCSVLSGRVLCDDLITSPEESYLMWRVVVCDQATSWFEETVARAGLHSQRNNNDNELCIFVQYEYLILQKMVLDGLL
jgi:hypothetical protein